MSNNDQNKSTDKNSKKQFITEDWKPKAVKPLPQKDKPPKK